MLNKSIYKTVKETVKPTRKQNKSASRQIVSDQTEEASKLLGVQFQRQHKRLRKDRSPSASSAARPLFYSTPSISPCRRHFSTFDLIFTTEFSLTHKPDERRTSAELIYICFFPLFFSMSNIKHESCGWLKRMAQ